MLIRVAGVRKRYGALTALDCVNLEIRRGELLGLLGPNGAGKTTLIHVLAGVGHADAGTVRIESLGDPATPSVRRSIGLAPQALALYPRLTAEENLRFFARLYGVDGPHLEASVAEGLRLADLQARAGDRIATFSEGMKRRLNLACALVHRPAVLLLDEPTAGVDPQSRNHLFAAIDRLRASGMTVVHSTHRMEEVEHLCDRVAIMDHGRMLAVGGIREVLERHASSDLATLFLSLTGCGLRD